MNDKHSLSLCLLAFFVNACFLFANSTVAQSDSSTLESNRLRVQQYDADEIEHSTKSVVGACGEKVKLPADWILRRDARVFRGVYFGDAFPNSATRTANLARRFADTDHQFENLFRLHARSDDPIVAADWEGRKRLRELSKLAHPIDVFVLQSGDSTRMAIDMDCDLAIQSDEMHAIQNAKVRLPGQEIFLTVELVTNERVDSNKGQSGEKKRANDSLASQQGPNDWRHHYDNDPLAEWVRAEKNRGATAEEILKRVTVSDSASSLHQARKMLLALDQVEIRKQHLGRVVGAADQVIRSLEPPSIDKNGIDKFKEPRMYARLVDACYRKGRALGYMELPEVLSENPIEDPAAHDQAFNETYEKLDALVDMDDLRFVLLQVRHHRRAGRPGLAFEKLQIYRNQSPNPKWYLKKQRDIASDTLPGIHHRVAHALWFEKSL